MKKVCYDETEDPVVRHEAILAFYDIVQDQELIDKLKTHENQLISESVVCAIHMDD